ncbi:hypothetical protein GCM10027317_35340 [Massilia agri]
MPFPALYAPDDAGQCGLANEKESGPGARDAGALAQGRMLVEVARESPGSLGFTASRRAQERQARSRVERWARRAWKALSPGMRGVCEGQGVSAARACAAHVREAKKALSVWMQGMSTSYQPVDGNGISIYELVS